MTSCDAGYNGSSTARVLGQRVHSSGTTAYCGSLKRQSRRALHGFSRKLSTLASRSSSKAISCSSSLNYGRIRTVARLGWLGDAQRRVVSSWLQQKRSSTWRHSGSSIHAAAAWRVPETASGDSRTPCSESLPWFECDLSVPGQVTESSSNVRGAAGAPCSIASDILVAVPVTPPLCAMGGTFSGIVSDYPLDSRCTYITSAPEYHIGTNHRKQLKNNSFFQSLFYHSQFIEFKRIFLNSLRFVTHILGRFVPVEGIGIAYFHDKPMLPGRISVTAFQEVRHV